jgi:hypothetical protein
MIESFSICKKRGGNRNVGTISAPIKLANKGSAHTFDIAEDVSSFSVEALADGTLAFFCF